MKRWSVGLAAPLGLLTLHLLGGREATSAIAGIASSTTEALMGGMYVLLWLVCATLVPIYVLSLGWLALARRFTSVRPSSGPRSDMNS